MSGVGNFSYTVAFSAIMINLYMRVNRKISGSNMENVPSRCDFEATSYNYPNSADVYMYILEFLMNFALELVGL